MKHFNHKLISFFFLYFATQSLKASGLSELCTVSQIGDAPGIIFLNTPTWGTGSVNGNIVFNFFTPNYWSAGCVATSMAEVMAYFQWPLSGTGLVSYQEDDAGNLSVNFGVAEYYLDKVLDDYTGGYTSEQRDLAAQISYHAAISVKMDFESLGSTASTRDIDDALKKYFCYSASYTSDLDKLVADIKKNIQSGHPGIISLEYIDSYGNKHGHAVVADGYSEAYGYHLNMGWNGNSANGWYDIEGTFNAGGYDTVTGGVVDIIPIPAIDKEITWYSEDSARVSWSVSPKLQSDYYQVQLLAPSGIWEIIADTLYNQNTLVCLNETGTWSVRVRGYYDGRYCDFSESYKIKIGSDVEVVFTIDMGSELMAGNEWLLLFGSKSPLGTVQNSPAFTNVSGTTLYTTSVIFTSDVIGDTLLYYYGVRNSTGVCHKESELHKYLITSDLLQELPVVLYNNSMSSLANTVQVETELIHCYPNPFNTSLTIDLPELNINFQHTLSIYNLQGKRVGKLDITAGRYDKQVIWNAADMASGMYIIRLDQNKLSQKIFLIK